MALETSPAPVGATTGGTWHRLSQPHYGIVFLAVVAIGFLAFDRVAELRRAYDAAESGAAAMAGNLALALASDFEFVVSQIDETLLILAEDLPNDPGFTLPGDAGLEARLKRRLSGLPPDVRGLYVLDEEGRFTHNTESPALVGANRSDRDYFRVTRDADGLYIGAPIRSRTNEQVVISLTRRINLPGGRFAGVVSASLPLGRLEEFYARFDLDPSVAIALWRTDGVLLARRPPAGDLVGRADPARPIQRAIDTGQRQGLFKASSPIDGRVRFASFRALERHPFVVTVAMGEDGYLADWRARRSSAVREFALIAAGLIGVAAALVVVFRRRSHERAEAERSLRGALIELDAANQAKTMFLANMSHELRTPLNAIIGFSEMIRDERLGAVGSRRYIEYANDIHDSGEHLLGIIGNILDISRVEAGKWALSPERFSAAEEITGCLRIVKSTIAGDGLRIVDAIPDGLPLVHADRRAFRQVLLNLLTNAIKFTPSGGTITVAASTAPDGGVTVSIRDTGIGIAPEYLADIGRPFVRVGDPLRSKVGGSGLGLALSRSLIEMQGGRLSIESTLGKGTAVEIWLPAA